MAVGFADQVGGLYKEYVDPYVFDDLKWKNLTWVKLWKKVTAVSFTILKILATLPFVWYNTTLFCFSVALGFHCPKWVKEEIEAVQDIFKYNHRGVIACIGGLYFLGLPAALFMGTIYVGGYWGSELRVVTNERKDAFLQQQAAAATS